MALRYALPNGTQLPTPPSKLALAPSLRAPVSVEYRGTASPEAFLAAVMGNPHVKVTGATAAGKSSVMPKLLASKARCTVFHVTAHPLLAYSASKFYEANPAHGLSVPGLKTAHMTAADQEVESGSLVWVSAPVFVAWLARDRAAQRSSLTGCIVILDEAHECDAYTHVVRSLSLAMKARSLLLVSATFDPSGHVVRSDKIVQSTFSQEDTPMTWDVTDASKPWSYAAIRDSALVFVDSTSAAAKLRSAYLAAGFDAYRLTARSSVQDYEQAMSAVGNSRGPQAVVIVDSSYRSGFNFDVSNIIDSGSIYYVPSTGMDIRYEARGMYNAEYAQTVGRAGRFSRTVAYSRPEAELPWAVCDLMPAEAEAAAYLYRCLGFQPVRELAATVMANDELPDSVDPVAALNGVYPMSAHCRGAVGERLQGVRSVTPEIVPRGGVLPPAARVVAETASGSSSGTAVSAGDDGPSSGEGDAARPGVDAADFSEVWTSVVNALQSGTDVEHIQGEYLYSPEVRVEGLLRRSEYFPRGVQSVLELATNNSFSTMVRSLHSEHRRFALYHSLQRHNALSAEVAGIKSALVESSRGREQLLAQNRVRYKIGAVVQKASEMLLERDALYEACVELAGNRYTLRVLSGLDRTEAARRDVYFQQFERVLQVAADEPEEYVREMERLSLRPPEAIVPTRIRREEMRRAIGDRRQRRIKDT